MRFKRALSVSLLLHLSLFAIMVYRPVRGGNDQTTYYVDLIQLPAGGGTSGVGSGPKSEAALMEERAASLKDLTVAKKQESSLRYPDREGKTKKEKEQAIQVVRKEQDRSKDRGTSTQTDKSNGLGTGITTGTGGPGSDGGDWGGYFPYAYYVETLRNKISAAWYDSLVSPGLKGKFLTQVYFIIRRNGQIDSLRIEKGTGIETLDLSALRAVQEAAPFSELPADFGSAYLVVHFQFEWEKR